MSKLIELNSEVEIYIKALQNNKQYKKSFAFIDYCFCLKNGTITQHVKMLNVGIYHQQQLTNGKKIMKL